MNQLTLIALYGNKTAAFSQLVSDCQGVLANFFPDHFNPYPLTQVHATLVGLERVPGTPRANRNLARYRGLKAEMDFKGLLATLRDGGVFPWRIQISGFQDRDYPFTSRGERPYRRSFSIQRNKAVLMGWPVQRSPLTHPDSAPLNLTRETGLYPPILDAFRRDVEQFNILHAYHRTPDDVDNDFYFRIGLFDSPDSLDPEAIRAAETTIRDQLAAQERLLLEIKRSDLRLASYSDETLPPETTCTWLLSDPRLTPELISNLYAEGD